MTILHVDPHPFFRMGFVDWVGHKAPDLVVEPVGSAEAAYERLRLEVFDMLVIELCFPGRDGFAILDKVLAETPQSRILVASHLPEDTFAHRTLCFGARGYVMKSEPPEVFLKAIREVASGNRYVSESVGIKLVQNLYPNGSFQESSLNCLSSRELQVFSLLGTEPSHAKIASNLCLGQKTVEAHIYNIRTKLGKLSLCQLRTLAQAWVVRGKLPPPESLG